MRTIEKKSLKVGKYVTNEHVETVTRTYKEERWKYNTERIGKADSLSVWWSVEDLEDYVAFIKEHGADGIRFYFAVYPENYEAKPLLAGRQTVVMVATKHREDGMNKDLYIGDGEKARLLAYNDSLPCPPLCTTTPVKPTTAGELKSGDQTVVTKSRD